MNCVIIDCDPGLDDAVALLAAFGAKDLDVLAITTVAGNVKGDQTAINACIIREVAEPGSRVPVCAGAPRPLLRDPVTAEDFHGSTGLGNHSRMQRRERKSFNPYCDRADDQHCIGFGNGSGNRRRNCGNRSDGWS